MAISKKEEQEIIQAIGPFLGELNKISREGTGIPGVSIASTGDLANLLQPREDAAMKQFVYVQAPIPGAEPLNKPQPEQPQPVKSAKTSIKDTAISKMKKEQKKPLTVNDVDILSDLDDTSTIDRELVKEKLKEIHALIKEIYEIIR